MILCNSKRQSIQETLPNDMLQICSQYLLTHSITSVNDDPYLSLHSAGPHTNIIYGLMDQNTEVLVKVWRISRPSPETRRTAIKRTHAALQQWEKASEAHPGFAHFIGLTAGFNEAQMPSLVLPRYGNGNAFEYLKKRGTSPDVNVDSMICDIADAVKFLHNQSPPIVHGQLYGKNILISDTGRPLLTDIGIAGLSHHLEGVQGCPSDELQRSRWMPPDLIDPSIVAKDLHFSLEDPDLSRTSSDVYSFGMTALELLTLRVPFSHIKRSVQVIYAISQGQRPRFKDCPEVDPDVWAILERCWRHYPSRRPTMDAVCSQLAQFNSGSKISS